MAMSSDGSSCAGKSITVWRTKFSLADLVSHLASTLLLLPKETFLVLWRVAQESVFYDFDHWVCYYTHYDTMT